MRPSADAAEILMRAADRALQRTPSILFIDDLDVITEDKILLNASIAMIDRVMQRGKVAVLATATNLLPAEFRNVNRVPHEITLDLPQHDQKVDILRVMLRGSDVPEDALDELANRDDLKTPADLRLAVDVAIMTHLEQLVRNGREQLTPAEVSSLAPGSSAPAPTRTRVVRASGPFSPATREEDAAPVPKKEDPFAFTSGGSGPDPFSFAAASQSVPPGPVSPIVEENSSAPVAAPSPTTIVFPPMPAKEATPQPPTPTTKPKPAAKKRKPLPGAKKGDALDPFAPRPKKK
jgi:hypothetical protein